MRIRGLIIFLISFVVGLFHSPKANKKNIESFDPIFFAGTWYFKDGKRTHKIVVEPDLKLKIDGREIATKIRSASRYQVSYVDKFGYKLELRANEARPVKFYDESDNDTYDLFPASLQG